MKTSRLLFNGLSATFALLLASASFGQGSLTPPSGAPAPTMKTLDQVEARTIVNATNTPGDATAMFIISAPGSYFLTGNIIGAPGKHGISVLASNVTLDLNGFALISGGGPATRGITTSTPIVNFSVRNGNVRGWADGGVRAEYAVTSAEKLLLADNVGGPGLAVGNGSLVKDCVASGNTTGFYSGDRTQINNCIATVNTGDGFNCTSYVNLIDCTSSRNEGSGIVTQGGCSIIRCTATRNLPEGSGIITGAGCSIINCTASNNGSEGISAGTGCTIADCTVGNNLGLGIFAGDHSTVRGCTVCANGEHGIFIISSCHILSNTCDLNGNSGIFAIGNGSRLDGNNCNLNTATGLVSRDSLTTRNSARGNGTKDFDISSNLIVSMKQGVVVPATVSPWANIVY